MTLIEAITLATAGIGAALGVINTVALISQYRVKLRIAPAYAFFTYDDGSMDEQGHLSIEVTNLSSFAVTINEVGFLLSGRKRALPTPVLGPTLPLRMEPRTSISFAYQAGSLDGLKIKQAYAATACGITKKGTSPALEQFRRLVS